MSQPSRKPDDEASLWWSLGNKAAALRGMVAKYEKAELRAIKPGTLNFLTIALMVLREDLNDQLSQMIDRIFTLYPEWEAELAEAAKAGASAPDPA